MALPKTKKQLHSVYLVGIDKEVKFKAFSVKEYKILLAAKESKDEKEMAAAIEQIVDNCLSTRIDIRKLPTFDIEKLFLAVVSKSRGEEHTIAYKYTYTDESGEEKNEKLEVTVNLEDIQVKQNPEHEGTDVVDAGEDEDGQQIKIVMTYPTLEIALKSSDPIDNIIDCIKLITVGDEIVRPEDEDREGLEEWIEDLDGSVVENMKKFFDTMPHVYHKEVVPLPDGKTKEVEFKSMSDFFI